MAFKGFNSILFDFYSLVDAELSLISLIKEEYKDEELKYLDKHRILNTEEGDLKFYRIHGEEDLFRSLIIGEAAKQDYAKILWDIVKSRESSVLEKYACPTSIGSLIRAYQKAGDGVIHTAVRCDTEAQKEYIMKHFPDTNIEFSEKENVDMSNYGRLIVGDWRHALEYRLKEPKSILVLDYRDNFSQKDSTLLKAELIINLGDIHDIGVISAYRDDTQES